MGRLILVINPGSTSTKISVFNEAKEMFPQTLRHTNEELAPFPDVISQKDFRRDIIKNVLAENNIDFRKFDDF